MSKGLKYYTHKVDSHNHWKFKLLRKKFGWEGEGKFWALNNMIAESPHCKLDLSDENKQEQIAADLNFEKEEFLDFLKYLVSKCRLIKNGDGKYSTDSTQEDLEKWEKIKKYDNARK
jgi:hypothetical protein